MAIAAVRTFVMVLLAFVAQHAAAECLDPTSWPQTIEVTEAGGRTRLILGRPLTSIVNVESVAVSGSNVTVNIGFADGACISGAPPTPRLIPVDLPQLLSAGTYQLTVLNRRITTGVTNTVTRSFEVVGAGAGSTLSVPMLGTPGIFLLVALFAALGVPLLRGVRRA